MRPAACLTMLLFQRTAPHPQVQAIPKRRDALPTGLLPANRDLRHCTGSYSLQMKAENDPTKSSTKKAIIFISPFAATAPSQQPPLPSPTRVYKITRGLRVIASVHPLFLHLLLPLACIYLPNLLLAKAPDVANCTTIDMLTLRVSLQTFRPLAGAQSAFYRLWEIVLIRVGLCACRYLSCSTSRYVPSALVDYLHAPEGRQQGREVAAKLNSEVRAASLLFRPLLLTVTGRRTRAPHPHTRALLGIPH